jgi:site-specific recombinase XerD
MFGLAGSLFIMITQSPERSVCASPSVGADTNNAASARLKLSALKAKTPPGCRQHDLRHRRITTWLAEEKHAVHVKEAVGHDDLQTTMKYTHLAKEHLRSLVDDSPKRQREGLGT